MNETSASTARDDPVVTEDELDLDLFAAAVGGDAMLEAFGLEPVPGESDAHKQLRALRAAVSLFRPPRAGAGAVSAGAPVAPRVRNRERRSRRAPARRAPPAGDEPDPGGDQLEHISGPLGRELRRLARVAPAEHRRELLRVAAEARSV